MFWDFLSLTPESIHQVTILFSDRGTPLGYRHMNGYSGHTFKWYNDKDEYFWVKIHFKTEQGIQNFTREEANRMCGRDPDYATRDLHYAIKGGETPVWKVYAQIMNPKQVDNYRFNSFDRSTLRS
jgi:catalase